MSERLQNLVAANRKMNRKLLSVFVTAGFPQANATVEIVRSLAQAGVDFIELGIPFSDPIADGPVIQAASQKALQNGFRLDHVFDMVKQIRSFSSIPILLMGYLNPVYRMGVESFIRKSHEAGVDGLIIPDLPPNESKKVLPLLAQNDLDLIHLIAPNTPAERITEIDKISTAFIYCVAYAGVTGQNNQPTQKTIDFFHSLQTRLQHPFMIGFGVKSRQDFRMYSQYADGVIIGSAFIRLLEQTEREDWDRAIKGFVGELR